MTVPTITPLPTAPTRRMAKGLFSLTVAAFLAAMVTLAAEINAVLAWLVSYANSYLLSLNGTSITSLTIGTGSKTLTTQAGLGYRLGTTIYVSDASGNRMVGAVTAYNSTTGVLTFTSEAVQGAGTASAWTLGAAAMAPLKNNLSHTPVIAKGNSGTATQTFDVAAGEVQSVTVTGAHAWAFVWPPGHSEVLVVATNPGLYPVTLPVGTKFILGDGSTSTTFSDMGVTLQTSGKNRYSFTTDDGGATVECVVS